MLQPLLGFVKHTMYLLMLELQNDMLLGGSVGKMQGLRRQDGVGVIGVKNLLWSQP